MKTIEVFADVRCPFAHVGLRRLTGRLAAAGADVALWVRAWPLELVNGAPLERALIAEEVGALREQVAPDLFAGFTPDCYPATSLPALGLAAAAYRQDPTLGERASLMLRDAMFEHGRDIAQPGELARVAHDLELGGALDGAQAVLDDWEEGRRRGVIGSPHFFVDGDSFFCPALQIERVGGHLRIASDGETFAMFVERCVAV